jgi:hypothetical protein
MRTVPVHYKCAPKPLSVGLHSRACALTNQPTEKQALVAAGELLAPAGGYAVQGGVWLTAFQEAFDHLDHNGSGTLASSDIMVRQCSYRELYR